MNKLRGNLALLALLVAPASADPRKALEKRGYKSSTVLFESPTLQVASATKQGKVRLVIVTAAGAVVDAGPPGTGSISIAEARQESSTKPVATNAGGLTLLEVSYRTERGKGGSATESVLWAVRASGSIACSVPGSSVTSLGTACGSSGWTHAKAFVDASSTGTTLEVTYENAGIWSEPDGKGGCVNRSPVRSSTTERWTIAARGMCKKAPG